MALLFRKPALTHRQKIFLATCLACVAFFLSGEPAKAQGQGPAASAQSKPQAFDLEKAELLVQKGQLSEAESIVRAGLKTQPQSAAGHFLLGYILFREIQARAAHADPNPNAVYSAPSKSLVELRETNAKESLAEFTAGARYHTPSAFDLKIVAMDYILLGDFIDADKWLTRSLQWNPGDSDAWYELGRTKYNENRFTEAIDAFKKCLASDARNVKAEENLALSYAGLGEDPQAISAYQAAIDWQAAAARKDPEAYLGLGTLLLNQNRPKDAIPPLLEATRIAPSVSQAHELLGKAYVQTNDLAKAQAELEQAVKLSPATPRLHYILGQVYRKEGLTAQAKKEFDRCAALQGTRSSDPSTM